jgi:hypothetical protein
MRTATISMCCARSGSEDRLRQAPGRRCRAGLAADAFAAGERGELADARTHGAGDDRRFLRQLHPRARPDHARHRRYRRSRPWRPATLAVLDPCGGHVLPADPDLGGRDAQARRRHSAPRQAPLRRGSCQSDRACHSPHSQQLAARGDHAPGRWPLRRAR